MKKTLILLISLFLLLSSCDGFGFIYPADGTATSAEGDGDPIIADHEYGNLSALLSIPVETLDKVKSDLHIAFTHTSHGSQITSGMTGLVSFMNNRGGYDEDYFAWNNGGSEGALDLHDYAMSSWDDLGTDNWDDLTRTYLGTPDNSTGRGQTNSDVNVVIWAWCGQVSDISESDLISRYLSPMSTLEEEYPGIRFVYMTGHLDGSGLTGNLHLRNEQIRTFCEQNGKILFDFADIETYDPDGQYYGDRYPTDACNYDYDNSGWTSQDGDPALPTDGDRNWATAWQEAHIEDTDWYDCYTAHSQPLTANQKTYAMWWLLSKLAD
ncbi:MAG: hypothetical protein JXR86_04690 [Spirochaetales bacterium]|nr:hypothetical protein [Spirochaetales bacterium]